MFYPVTITNQILNTVSFYPREVKEMINEIERGTLICTKRSTKHLIQGIIYKVVGTTLTGRHYIVICPYAATKHYVHKNNIRIMS